MGEIQSPPKRPKPIFKPMPGRVVVQLDNRERVGSLYLPTNSRESRVFGKVIAIGEDEGDGDFYDLREGDLVMFGQHAGVTVSIEQEKALILGTREILCRVEFEDGEGARRPEIVEVGEGDLTAVDVPELDPEQAEVIELEGER